MKDCERDACAGVVCETVQTQPFHTQHFHVQLFHAPPFCPTQPLHTLMTHDYSAKNSFARVGHIRVVVA